MGRAFWGWRESLPIIVKSSLIFRADSLGGGEGGLSRLLRARSGNLEREITGNGPSPERFHQEERYWLLDHNAET